MSSLVILTGASGAGKTTIARAFADGYGSLAEVCYFDSIGIPSPAEMVAQFGSGEEWQRSKTLEWMDQISRRLSGRTVLFEGQMRLKFIREAARAADLSDYAILLVDCDDATRLHRLSQERRQADLASDEMMNWARYLRKEAMSAGDHILDTTGITITEAVEIVRRYFD